MSFKIFIMRFTLLFLSCCMTLSIATAEETWSQGKNENDIRLSFTDASMVPIIEALNKQTGYNFFYDESHLSQVNHVTIKLENATLQQALDQITKQTNLKFYKVNDTYTIVPFLETKEASASKQQGITVTGTITDKGDPMPGVNVVIRGTSTGVITDINGKYTITVPDKSAILVFSFVGYITNEFMVGDQTVINIVLEEDTREIEEVVVIGYGTARKSDVTGAVTRADMSAMANSPNVNIYQGLKGVVSGLNIGAATRAGDDPQISIRGQNSISGTTSPLIVLDGIIYRGSITDINPNDIESIDVLKDASSTAIYGSQAANGVLMITTKTVKTASKPIIEYNGSFAFQALMNKDMKRLDRDGFIQQISDIYLGDSWTNYSQLNPNFDVRAKIRDTAQKGYTDGTNTDWYDLLSTPTPYIQNHSLSLRGRTDLASYFVSFGFTDQKNLVKTDTYQRYNMRINLDANVTNWLKIGTQSFFTINDLSGNNTSFGSLIQLPALVSPYNSDGESYITTVYQGVINPLLTKDNPDRDVRYNLTGNFYADITIPWVKGLSYRMNYSNNLTMYQRYTFDPYANKLLGQARKRNQSDNSWTLDNIVTYKRDFGKHSVNATFVYGVEKRTSESTDPYANIFVDPTLEYNRMQAAQADQNTISSSAWEETSLYNMLRLSYTYNSRYIFTGTIRRDGFSGFSEDHKFAYFPSAAVAWRMSEENFLKDNITWIDNLKLRLSYGTSGNRTMGRYATLAQMTSRNPYGSATVGYIYGDGGTGERAQAMGQMANTDLKWETTNAFNFGIDFSVLRGRLFGTYDFYVSNTHDLLYNVQVPNINGNVNPTGTNLTVATNIGKMGNIGHELSITGIPIKTQDFEWTVTGNFSINKNKVKSILGIDANGDGKEDDLISDKIFIGKPFGVVYDYNITGMWQVDDYNKGAIPSGFYVGTYKVEDINNDGSYKAADDRKILGYTEPLYRFSIQNNFRYKDFELKVFINSVQGGSDYYLGQPLSRLMIPDHLTNWSYFKFDYWTPDNPGAKYRQLGAYNNDEGVGFSPYVSRSFIRLQELSLSYNVPASFLKKFNVNRLRVFISATNLFTITSWDGWDPEANQGITYELQRTPGSSANMDGYPTMKSYSVGLNLEF